MISLTIASTAGTATIPDSGSSGYVLVSYSPGAVRRDNAYAESRWLDGASLVSSRTDLLSISATVRVYGTSLAHVVSQAAALGTIVDSFDYTVTASYTGGSVVYDAMPASYALDYDPVLLRSNQALMTLDIPVQP